MICVLYRPAFTPIMNRTFRCTTKLMRFRFIFDKIVDKFIGKVN